MRLYLRNDREEKIGKINDKNGEHNFRMVHSALVSGDISTVLRNKKLSCFAHKPIRF